MSCVAGVCSCPVAAGRSSLIETLTAATRVLGATGGGLAALMWSNSTLTSGRVAILDGSGAMLPGMPRSLSPTIRGGAFDIVWNGTAFVAYWPANNAAGRLRMFAQTIAIDGTFTGAAVDVSSSLPTTIAPILEADVESLGGAGVALLGTSSGELYFHSLGTDGISPGPHILLERFATVSYELSAGGGQFAALYEQGGVLWFQPIGVDATLTAAPLDVDGFELVHDGASWVLFDYQSSTSRLFVWRGASFETRTVFTGFGSGAHALAVANGSRLYLSYRTSMLGMNQLTSHRFSAPADLAAAVTAIPPSWTSSDSTTVESTPFVAMPLGADRFVTAWYDTRAGMRGVRASVTSLGVCP